MTITTNSHKTRGRRSPTKEMTDAGDELRQTPASTNPRKLIENYWEDQQLRRALSDALSEVRQQNKKAC